MAKKKKGLSVKKAGGQSNIPNRSGLVPEVPFRAPAGSYDVGLDAAERAAGRGLQDLLGDLGRDQERADVQANWGRDDITRGRDEAYADLDTSQQRFDRDLGINRQRGQEDYTVGKTRLGEDYSSSLANLARNYQRLGNSQRQAATAAGVTRGGTLAAAARRRTENQAWDRKPIDQGFQRGNEDMDRSWNRQNQDWNIGAADRQNDYSQQRGRIGSDADRNLGRLNVTGTWDATDRTTQGVRAQRENSYFGQDTQAARIQQVQQTAPGWLDDWNNRNRNRGFRTW